MLVWNGVATRVRGVKALTVTIKALLKGVTIRRVGIGGVGVWPRGGLRGMSRKCSIMGRGKGGASKGGASA